MTRGVLSRSELRIIHFVLNTDCNAWDLKAAAGSPGVCRFCYRERNRVQASWETVRAVLNRVREQSEATRIVFTGGDPLMPYDNHLERALAHAASLGFEINVHTNGLLLQERYAAIGEHVDVFSLAIDGPDAETADWFRGHGYFERFTQNVDLLIADARTLAFNTFTAPTSLAKLPALADMIAGIARRTRAEYWLISQYRPIGRADQRKSEIYGHSCAGFAEAVEAARTRLPEVEIFAQPTRADDDPYPFRVWILADGAVTVDLGSVAAPRNALVGNVLTDGFAAPVRRAFALRNTETPKHP